MITHLVFDISNVLQRTYLKVWNGVDDRDDMFRLTILQAFTTLNKYYNQFKPDHIVCAFDRPNWRVDYTKSEKCISQRIYKGKRRVNFTPMELQRYSEFKEHVMFFEDMIRQYTSIVVLSGDQLEADDVIAGYAQRFGTNDRVIIISADKDLIQLMRFPNTILIDPNTNSNRTCDDIDYYMFEKCIRGDQSDNVASAFPKVRSTRLKKAFNDPYEYTNLMNETWITPYGNEIKVGDLFNENILLMDLFKQPDHIKQLINESIDYGIKTQGKYDHFQMIKYCNRNGLIKLREQLGNYKNLFSKRCSYEITEM